MLTFIQLATQRQHTSTCVEALNEESQTPENKLGARLPVKWRSLAGFGSLQGFDTPPSAGVGRAEADAQRSGVMQWRAGPESWAAPQAAGGCLVGLTAGWILRRHMYM